MCADREFDRVLNMSLAVAEAFTEEAWGGGISGEKLLSYRSATDRAVLRSEWRALAVEIFNLQKLFPEWVGSDHVSLVNDGGLVIAAVENRYVYDLEGEAWVAAMKAWLEGDE